MNRPFDDQSQERVRVESEAELSILQRVQTGIDQWVGSDVLTEEMDQVLDEERRSALKAVALEVNEVVDVDRTVRVRATELMGLGFAEMDARHLSAAEKDNVDAFITVDDKLLRRASRYKDKLAVRVVTPISCIVEHLR